jgi:hypothetical protein
MNLRKSLFTGIAAVGLMASVAAPAALAAPPEASLSNNTTVAYVNVTTDGQFDVYFDVANFSLGTVALNANNPVGTATGSMRINYIDTMADRPNFNVTVTAGNFDNINSGDPAHIIDAENFQVTHTYNVQQGYWDGNSPGGVDVGDIGYFVDGAYTAQNPAGAAWTGSTNLGDGPTVQFGYAGSGTSWSYGDVDLKLNIPGNTVAGQYNSDVTLSVITGSQP